MKIYILKISTDRIEKLLSFTITYGITILVAWQQDDFFSSVLNVIISNQESNGITSEEKDRLINESGFKIEKQKDVTI